MLRRALISVLFVISCAGCTNPVLLEEVRFNDARAAGFVAAMDEGRTTPEEEKAFIRSNARAFKAIRGLVERKRIERKVD